MIELCILFLKHLVKTPLCITNNWVRDNLIELDHPPKISIMMLYCVILYPLNCCLSSRGRGPYFNAFSSSFFSRFWIQGQLISRVVTFFAWWSTIFASALLALNSLYSANKGEHPSRPVHPRYRRVILAALGSTKVEHCQLALDLVEAQKIPPSRLSCPFLGICSVPKLSSQRGYVERFVGSSHITSTSHHQVM